MAKETPNEKRTKNHSGKPGIRIIVKITAAEEVPKKIRIKFLPLSHHSVDPVLLKLCPMPLNALITVLYLIRRGIVATAMPHPIARLFQK